MPYVGFAFAIEYHPFLCLDEIILEQYACWLVIFDVTYG